MPAAKYTHGQRVTSIGHLTARDYTLEGQAKRRPNAKGSIVDVSDAHGLCWGVEHDDGTIAWYDTDELEPCGTRRYELVVPRAREVAQGLAKRALGDIWTWEVLEELVEALGALPDGMDVEFVREEPDGHKVYYSLREMRICVKQSIECRPQQP